MSRIATHSGFYETRMTTFLNRRLTTGLNLCVRRKIITKLCSLCQTNDCKRKHVNADPSVVETVSKNIYVDDLCKFWRSVDETVSLLSQLCALLASKGFHLTKFSSNNKQMLSLFLQEDVVPSVNLENSTLPVHKALGILWVAASDEIRVKVDVKKRPMTLRSLLSMVSQTYDPLGMLQPFLLPPKLFLQEACRAERGWDDELTALLGVGEKWSHWFQALPELQHVSLERSFTLLDREIKNIELNTFADASTKSYDVCSHLRITSAIC